MSYYISQKAPTKWTAGGAGAKILIPIVKIIGIDIELAIVRIPIGINQTSARLSFSFVLSTSDLETILYLLGQPVRMTFP